MNTKEAIEFLTKEINKSDKCERLDVYFRISEADNIIELLQRGEKYEKVVKEIEEFLEPGVIYEIPLGMEGSRHIDIIKHIVGKIKQKHFPSPFKKTITIEVEATNENVIKWAEHEIKDLENNVWNHILKVNITTKGGTQ